MWVCCPGSKMTSALWQGSMAARRRGTAWKLPGWSCYISNAGYLLDVLSKIQYFTIKAYLCLVRISHILFLNLSQSPCAHYGDSPPQISSPGSCPCSGRIWRSTWHAATPTQCPCATATPWREEAAATTPPYASALQWNTMPHASRCVICHPTMPSMSVCHWQIQRGRKRAERSPFRRRRTVSPRRRLQKRQ